MRYTYLSAFFRQTIIVIRSALRRRWGRRLAAVLLLSAAIWIWRLPVVQLTYGAIIYPLRGMQYYFSADRPDAARLSELAGLAKGQGGILAHLDALGFWAVLHALRTEKLSLPQQALALAFVHQESSFRFYSKNRKSSACGLFQLISATGEAKDLPWWQCMDPVQNTRAGVRFFREVSARAPAGPAGDARCSYLRYYYGPGNRCGSDTKGIWKKVGSRITGRTALYLKALKQIQREEEQRGFFGRSIQALSPYLPFILLGALFAALKYLSWGNKRKQ